MAKVGNWLVLSEDKTTIINCITATDEQAEEWNLVPMYEGSVIGQSYDPPKDKTELEQAQDDLKPLKAQLAAATERREFLEDCIAEMAMVVYGA